MKRNRAVPFAVLTVSLLGMSLTTFAGAEPEREAVQKALEAKREVAVQALAALSSEEVFARLKDARFVSNRALMNRAICATFDYRKSEAVALAMGHVRLPIMRRVSGIRAKRAADFYVAKNVLQAYPDVALPGLIELYNKNGPMVKGNVVRVLGEMAGGWRVRDLLVQALDDRTYCARKGSRESPGIPLRVCDVAYNQLVLRYKIKDIPRSIGSIHGIRTRDLHIGQLKRLLSGSLSLVSRQQD